MKLYCDDDRDDAASLSLIEYGAYTKLINAYLKGGPLPSDINSLYRICRAVLPVEKWAVKGVARRFFMVSETDGLRHNQVADNAIAKAKPRIEAARLNGKKGGRPPKNKRDIEHE